MSAQLSTQAPSPTHACACSPFAITLALALAFPPHKHAAPFPASECVLLLCERVKDSQPPSAFTLALTLASPLPRTLASYLETTPPPFPAPQYVFLLCERVKDRKPSSNPSNPADDDCCKKKPKKGCGINSCSDYDSDDNDPYNSGSYSEGLGALGGMMYSPYERKAHERFGTPLLVPFPARFADKGPEAAAAVRKVCFCCIELSSRLV